MIISPDMNEARFQRDSDALPYSTMATDLIEQGFAAVDNPPV
jgi:hypothetical protein